MAYDIPQLTDSDDYRDWINEIAAHERDTLLADQDPENITQENIAMWVENSPSMEWDDESLVDIYRDVRRYELVSTTPLDRTMDTRYEDLLWRAAQRTRIRIVTDVRHVLLQDETIQVVLNEGRLPPNYTPDPDSE